MVLTLRELKSIIDKISEEHQELLDKPVNSCDMVFESSEKLPIIDVLINKTPGFSCPIIFQYEDFRTEWIEDEKELSLDETDFVSVR